MTGDPRSAAAPLGGGGESAFTIRPLADPAELRRAAVLHREVFGHDAADALPPRLLVAARGNSGITLGAYDGERLVGFAFSFLARAPRDRLYQYSQTAVVLPSYQGRGVGRALKLGQRREALRQGIDLIRWAFDPMRARNAHFNLDVLGALGRGFEPDFYGVEQHGSTDRFIVDWELTSPRVVERCAASGRAAERPPLPEGRAWRPGQHEAWADAILLAVPADWDRYVAEVGEAAAARLREGVRERLVAALDAGGYADSCVRVDAEVALYRLRVPDPSGGTGPGGGRSSSGGQGRAGGA